MQADFIVSDINQVKDGEEESHRTPKFMNIQPV
jgi:hypothetical protein